jgi:hypothetical protein
MADPAAVTVGNILRVSIFQILNSQRLLTVLHFRVSVAPGSGTYMSQMKEVSDLVAGNIEGELGQLGGWSALVSQQLRFDKVRCQRVFGTRDIYMETLMNKTGNNIEDAVAPNLACSIEKRTTTFGPSGIGRVQMGGIPKTVTSNGVLDSTWRILVKDVWDDLTTEWALGGTFKIRPVIVPAEGPMLPNDIVDVVVQDTIRTMHRRTLRLGE